MKRKLRVILLVAAICLSCQTVQADLTRITDGTDTVASDSETDLLWYADMRPLVYKTYAEQLTVIDNLNSGDGYFEVTNWHLATYTEMASLWGYSASEIMDNITPSAVQLTENSRWGRYQSQPSGAVDTHYIAYLYLTGGKNTLESYTWWTEGGDNNRHYELGAWVVGTAPAVVPVPGSVLLGMLGLGVAGVKLRKFA